MNHFKSLPYNHICNLGLLPWFTAIFRDLLHNFDFNIAVQDSHLPYLLSLSLIFYSSYFCYMLILYSQAFKISSVMRIQFTKQE